MSTPVCAPSDTTDEKPTPLCRAQSRIDTVSAPDCDTSPSGRPRPAARHAGVELQRRALEAQAVGPQQRDALAPRDALQLVGLLGPMPVPTDQRGTAAHARGQLQPGGDLGRRAAR
jgi:hypothetical protein